MEIFRRFLEVPLMMLAGFWQGIRLDFNLLEIFLLAAGIWAWRRGWRPPRLRTPRVRRPWIWALGIASATIGLRLALIPVLGVPIPVVTDEFSHFLLADTLLHGRVSNPTPLFPEHFESLHILVRPKYVSNFFPGHALVLASARAVANSLWAGILFECFAFLLALYWMLRGWLPPRWALFGVLLGALRFGIGSYWMNAYHGGFLPAIGGALAAGAFARLLRRATLTGSLLLGAGFAILVATRPFEGFFFALAIVVLLLLKSRPVAALIPVLILPALTVAGLGVYFRNITGSPLITPYQISQKTYGWPMTMAWITPPHIEHANVELRQYYEYELSEHERVDGPVHYLEYLPFRVQECWRFFLGPILTLPLIFFGRVWKRRRMLVIPGLAALAAVLTESSMSPHYLAPAAAVIIAILVECCRYLPARVIPLLPAAMLAVLTLRAGAETAGLPYTQAFNYQSWCCKVEGNLNKHRIENTLLARPGKSMVFVQAKTDPLNLLQWIYNDADLEDARILWVRDLGAAKNARLIQEYSSREVWFVNPNVEPATCVPYATSLDQRGEGRSGRTISQNSADQ